MSVYWMTPLPVLRCVKDWVRKGPSLRYVIAWFAGVFKIISTNNAEIIVRGVAEYNLLHYECY